MVTKYVLFDKNRHILSANAARRNYKLDVLRWATQRVALANSTCCVGKHHQSNLSTRHVFQWLYTKSCQVFSQSYVVSCLDEPGRQWFMI